MGTPRKGLLPEHHVRMVHIDGRVIEVEYLQFQTVFYEDGERLFAVENADLIFAPDTRMYYNPENGLLCHTVTDV